MSQAFSSAEVAIYALGKALMRFALFSEASKLFPLTHLGPHLPVPLCPCALLDHTRLREHTKEMGRLIQCPITFVFLHRSLPSFVCLQTI